jgi:hypothetical protein
LICCGRRDIRWNSYKKQESRNKNQEKDDR